MLDFTCIVLLSLGLTTAKTDLNSHQPYSKPAFFPEASVRFQKSNLAFFGLRASYYNVPLEVRDIFQDNYGKQSQVHHGAYTLFLGKGVHFNPDNYLSLDVGPAYIPTDSKWGGSARLRYTREVETRRGKNFNLSASLGMDYWAQDDLDNHEDVTTLDGDYMMHLTIGIGLPINPRPD